MPMPLQLRILWSIQPRNIVLSIVILPVCLRDFSAVERKDNIVCCLCFILKLHPRTNLPLSRHMYFQRTVRVHEQTFPLKKALTLLAALCVNYFHQLASIYFLEKSRSRLLGETELLKSTRYKCFK